jgi:hypothetical protein
VRGLEQGTQARSGLGGGDSASRFEQPVGLFRFPEVAQRPGHREPEEEVRVQIAWRRRECRGAGTKPPGRPGARILDADEGERLGGLHPRAQHVEGAVPITVGEKLHRRLPAARDQQRLGAHPRLVGLLRRQRLKFCHGLVALRVATGEAIDDGRKAEPFEALVAGGEILQRQRGPVRAALVEPDLEMLVGASLDERPRLGDASGDDEQPCQERGIVGAGSGSPRRLQGLDRLRQSAAKQQHSGVVTVLRAIRVETGGTCQQALGHIRPALDERVDGSAGNGAEKVPSRASVHRCRLELRERDRVVQQPAVAELLQDVALHRKIAVACRP